MAEIKIFANNRNGLLADISKALTEKNINILSMNTRTSKQGLATLQTTFEIQSREELNRVISEVDYVTVASSSAARALAAMLEPEQRKKLTAKLISIGPSTTKAMEKLGLPVYSDAVEYTAEGIASVIRADVEEML